MADNVELAEYLRSVKLLRAERSRGISVGQRHLRHPKAKSDELFKDPNVKFEP
jgi:hypothetical protein